LIKGYTAYKAPAKELRWNGRDEARLAVRPEALGPIEELRRELEQTEGQGKAQAECMHLGRQIKPRLVYDDEGLDIDWLNEGKQIVLPTLASRGGGTSKRTRRDPTVWY